MTDNAVEKARKAAEAAAAKVAELERQEAEKAAQKAAERDNRQRELDAEFLAQWEKLDAELQEVGAKSATDAVYEGADPVTAIAHFWVERARRNSVRAHARSAYYRLHGVHPDDLFARDLPDRDMRIADRLEEAIYAASRRHGADLADKLEAEWTAE
ncbi:hypothetical protein AB0E76_07090 [Streptomyces fungicidicus]|uniref:hypothetical protein n=1 Tax=Streptomyces fungicidicus TaxID=68203 RepID=UPI0033D9AF56